MKCCFRLCEMIAINFTIIELFHLSSSFSLVVQQQRYINPYGHYTIKW